VCPDTEFVKLDCIRGHDSFLVEMDAFRPVLSRYFDSRG
jgi:homoserine acetyltransferase